MNWISTCACNLWAQALFYCIKAFSACSLLLLCKNNHFHHV
nr:MAG TPA: hypothetical protein [Caudoviricetes sp.]